jgi:hypothetical protein
MSPTIIDIVEYTELYSSLESDYNQIRKDYIENGILKSETGVLLQNRTKGPRNSNSRAFYLRKKFIKQYITIS